jgi:hypothetical protein
MLPRFFAVAVVLIVAALLGQTATANAVGIGRICAGIAGVGCDEGLWCEIEPGMCNRADAEGRCVRAPSFCGMSLRPVCACGGRTYASDCRRQRDKAQKAHDGRCR